MRVCRRLVCLIALLGLLAPATAWAAKKKGGATAGEWYAKGSGHMQAKEYIKAAAAFQAAFDLDPDPVLLWNIARAFEEAGENEKAKLKFQEFTAHPKAPAELRERALKHLRAVEDKIKAKQAEERAERERKRKELEAKLEAERKAKEKERIEREKRLAELRKQQDKVDLVPWGWASVGVGTALGVTGLILHLEAESKRDTVLNPTMNEAGAISSLTQREAQAVEEDADSMDTIALTTTVIGGAVVVTGVVLLVLDATSGSETKGSTTIGAAVDGDGVLVTAGGQF